MYNVGGAGINSYTFTGLTGAQTAGNCNVAVLAYGAASSAIPPTSFTDSAGNQYILAFWFAPNTSPYLYVYVYFCAVIKASGAGNAVTVNWGSNINYPQLNFLEIAGASKSAPIDIATAGYTYVTGGGGSTNSVAPSFVTTFANELICGTWVQNFNGGGQTFTGAPWVLPYAAAQWMLVDPTPSAAGTATPSATMNWSGYGASAIGVSFGIVPEPSHIVYPSDAVFYGMT